MTYSDTLDLGPYDSLTDSESLKHIIERYYDYLASLQCCLVFYTQLLYYAYLALPIQLLDRRVTDDLGNDEHQQVQGIIIANASNISCHSTCSENTTDHTSSMSTFSLAFAAATETDLKHDLRIYWINL